MKSPTSDSRRLMRASVIGVCSALLSTLGHTVAGFAQPHHEVNWWALPVIAVVITIPAMIMSESEFTLGRLVGFMATTQLFTHIALSLGTGSGHQHGTGSHATTQARTIEATSGEYLVDFGPTIVMLLSHVIVGAAITWLLYQGESLMFRMHRQVPGFLKVLTGRGIPSQPPSLPTHAASSAVTFVDLDPCTSTVFGYLAADPRRGPPIPCA